MIATKMAAWTLICTFSQPLYLPNKQMQENIPNPQECETLASNCWKDYYLYRQRPDTAFDTMCKAVANHKDYIFHYECDRDLHCKRT